MSLKEYSEPTREGKGKGKKKVYILHWQRLVSDKVSISDMYIFGNLGNKSGFPNK